MNQLILTRLGLSISMCIIALAVMTLVPATITADLVARYDFEEGIDGQTATFANSILDSSGNLLHGTPIGGPVYRQAGGSLGLDFDGSDDRVFINDDPLFELTQSLTILAVIRIDALSSEDQRIAFRGDSRGGFDPYQLSVLADGRLEFSIHPGFGIQAAVRLKSENPLPLQEFLEVAGTLDDGTGRMNLFVNSEFAGTLITNMRPFGELDPLQSPGIGIGSRQDGTDNFFNGVIDEVRIYDEVLAIPEPSGAILCFATLFAFCIVVRRRSLCPLRERTPSDMT